MTEEEYIVVTQLAALNLADEALIDAGPPEECGIIPEDEYKTVLKMVRRWLSEGFQRAGEMIEED